MTAHNNLTLANDVTLRLERSYSYGPDTNADTGLNFADADQTLGGSGTVELYSGVTQIPAERNVRVHSTGGKLTVGPGVTVQNSSSSLFTTLGSSTTELVIAGTVSAESSGQTLRVTGSSVTNNGPLRVVAGALSTFNVDNQAQITVDGGGLTYSLTGGADAALFSINPNTRVLTFNSAPNYENPVDAGGDNVYDVQVTVTDTAGLTGALDIAVTVTNVDPSTPIDVDSALNSVPEGAEIGTAVGVTALSTDPLGPAVQFSLADDAEGRFAIDPHTGVVTVANALLLEGPAAYIIEVKVAEASGTVIGVNGYINGVDEFQGVGDTIIRDSNSSHTLDFSNTALLDIAEVDAAGGNDTIAVSNLSASSYRGGSGNDTFVFMEYDQAFEDQILDFQAQGVDKLDFTALGLAFGDIAVADADDDTLITLPGGRQIRLLDFIFANIDEDALLF